MATTDVSVADSATERVPTFDRTTWRPSTRRVAAAGCVVAFACALPQTPVAGPGSGWLLAGLMIAEVLALLLPWGLPRNGRGAGSFWLEALLGLTAPVGCLVVVLFHQPDWLRAAGDWPWYVAGVAFGAGLVALSGLDLRSLVSGDLAFVMGPTPRSHAIARACTSVTGPLGEEFLFRGVLLVAAAPVALPLGLLAAVAFVARHHVSAGSNMRGSARGMIIEITAAAGFLAMTMWSGSIYPALVAHLLNNVPMVVLHVQTALPGEDEL